MSKLELTGDLLLMAGQAPAVTRTPAADASTHTPLVEAARDGDQQAFGQLYKLYGPMVHGILLARVPFAEVDDIVQDVFLLAFRRLGSLREAAAFGAWLAMIARNRAMDFYRRSREMADLPEDLARAESGEIEAREVLALIRSLPEAYRETLMLRLVEGMTGPEISERTNLTPASVRVNLAHERRLLVGQIGRAGPGD
jgi:RNA polymerase sigma-70 factor (ECF subfamily)